MGFCSASLLPGRVVADVDSRFLSHWIKYFSFVLGLSEITFINIPMFNICLNFFHLKGESLTLGINPEIANGNKSN